jgi:prolipoprotein diacylglyceryltransferase
MPVPGMLYWVYLGLYSFGRFFMSFLRLDKVWIWNLREAQLVAILCMIASAFMLYRLSRPQLTRAQRRARARATGSRPPPAGQQDSGIPGITG